MSSVTWPYDIVLHLSHHLFLQRCINLFQLEWLYVCMYVCITCWFVVGRFQCLSTPDGCRRQLSRTGLATKTFPTQWLTHKQRYMTDAAGQTKLICITPSVLYTNVDARWRRSSVNCWQHLRQSMRCGKLFGTKLEKEVPLILYIFKLPYNTVWDESHGSLYDKTSLIWHNTILWTDTRPYLVATKLEECAIIILLPATLESLKDHRNKLSQLFFMKILCSNSWHILSPTWTF